MKPIGNIDESNQREKRVKRKMIKNGAKNLEDAKGLKLKIMSMSSALVRWG